MERYFGELHREVEAKRKRNRECSADRATFVGRRGF